MVVALLLGNCGHELPWGRVATPGGTLSDPTLPEGVAPLPLTPAPTPPPAFSTSRGPADDPGPGGRWSGPGQEAAAGKAGNPDECRRGLGSGLSQRVPKLPGEGAAKAAGTLAGQCSLAL